APGRGKPLKPSLRLPWPLGRTEGLPKPTGRGGTLTTAGLPSDARRLVTDANPGRGPTCRDMYSTPVPLHISPIALASFFADVPAPVSTTTRIVATVTTTRNCDAPSPAR